MLATTGTGCIGALVTGGGGAAVPMGAGGGGGGGGVPAVAVPHLPQNALSARIGAPHFRHTAPAAGDSGLGAAASGTAEGSVCAATGAAPVEAVPHLPQNAFSDRNGAPHFRQTGLSITGAAIGSGATAVPHFPQNTAPGRRGALHSLQVIVSPRRTSRGSELKDNYTRISKVMTIQMKRQSQGPQTNRSLDGEGADESPNRSPLHPNPARPITTLSESAPPPATAPPSPSAERPPIATAARPASAAVQRAGCTPG